MKEKAKRIKNQPFSTVQTRSFFRVEEMIIFVYTVLEFAKLLHRRHE